MAHGSTARAKPQAEDIDEELEQLASLVQRSRMTDKAIAAKISAARHSRMDPKTVTNVRELRTTRARNFTLKWIGWAIGYSREWRKL
jgi:hypothetical protein